MLEDLNEEQLRQELNVHATELRAQFEELVDSRAQLEQLTSDLYQVIENIPVGVVIVDTITSKILETNPKADKLLGKLLSESKSMLSSYFPSKPEGPEPAFGLFYNWFFSANERNTQLHVKNIWLELKKMPYQQDKLLVTLDDITAQKTLEINFQLQNEAYKTTNHQLSELISLMPGLIAIFDNQMNYIRASGRWIEVYQLPEDYIGQCHYELLPDIPSGWKSIHQRGLAGETIREEHDTYIHHDGSVQYLSWLVRPWFVSDDEIGGILIYVTDKTDFFKYQQERIGLLKDAKQQADQANAEKSRFLANMSHELRTPMHAILSFASLGLKKSTEDIVQTYLERIHTSGLRLTGLLNNLLDLSRLEAGKNSMDFELSSLWDVVSGVKKSLSSLLHEKNLQLCLDMDKALQLEMDKQQITQVIINLVGNSIKFSEPGKNIEIKAKEMIVTDSLGDENWIEISIRDYGIGIPDEDLLSVFDAFVQSSKTMSSAGGTGLGLSISKNIIDQHHGIIYAKATEDHSGSCFIIELPQHRSKLLTDNLVPIKTYFECLHASLLEINCFSKKQGMNCVSNLQRQLLKFKAAVEFFSKNHQMMKDELSELVKEYAFISMQKLQTSLIEHQTVDHYDHSLKLVANQLLSTMIHIINQSQLDNIIEPMQTYHFSNENAPLVLVVEDNEVVRMSIVVILEEAGYRVLEAANGNQAMDLIKNKPDMLITDLVMPERNGLTIILQIREKHPSMPIIAISSDDLENSGLLNQAHSAGADETMQKPVNASVLLSRVKYLLNNKY